jgi:hypothetical protein
VCSAVRSGLPRHGVIETNRREDLGGDLHGDPETQPRALERAALRWLARYAVERAGSLADVRAAADAFAVMVQRPDDALLSLPRLL